MNRVERSPRRAPQTHVRSPRRAPQAPVLPLIPLLLVPVVALLALSASGPARALDAAGRAWSLLTTPSPGPSRTIGRHGGGCIAGAQALPPEGEGYQAVDMARSRHFGHPMLVDFIRGLGRQASEAGLGTLLIGDMAQPRGGPMSSGHVSHQSGLDVDIWFRLDLPPLPRAEREGLSQPLVVDTVTGQVDAALFDARHAEVIRRAATDARVSRVFVGAAVKRDLCERTWSDRSWLHRVRPWPNHDEHMHVRLRCPEDSPACAEQPSLPAHEGCGAALAPFLAGAPRRVATEPRQNLPRACAEVLRE